MRGDLVSIDLRIQFKLAQQAIQTRDDFLSMASHELKTPLTSMSLQSQTARRRLRAGTDGPTLVERMSRTLQRIDVGIDRLVRLVDDMLDVSRISSGKLTIVRERVEIVALASDIVDRMRGQFDTAPGDIAPGASWGGGGPLGPPPYRAVPLEFSKQCPALRQGQSRDGHRRADRRRGAVDCGATRGRALHPRCKSASSISSSGAVKMLSASVLGCISANKSLSCTVEASGLTAAPGKALHSTFVCPTQESTAPSRQAPDSPFPPDIT